MQIEPLKYREIRQFSTIAKNIIRNCKYYSGYARSEELKKFSINALHRRSRKNDYLCLVAKMGNNIVGFCCGSYDAGTFWIDWIGVEANYRKRGIAVKLLKTVEETVKKSGAHKIWCDTRITNKPSMLLLRNANFVKVGEFKRHWYGQDFYFWEKII